MYFHRNNDTIVFVFATGKAGFTAKRYLPGLNYRAGKQTGYSYFAVCHNSIFLAAKFQILHTSKDIKLRLALLPGNLLIVPIEEQGGPSHFRLVLGTGNESQLPWGASFPVLVQIQLSIRVLKPISSHSDIHWNNRSSKYSETSLQRQHLFTKLLPLTWICFCKESFIDRMVCMQERPCFILFSSQNICFGYLLESPQRGDSNKYPKHMLLDVLIQYSCFLHNFSLTVERKFRDSQIFSLTNFVVVSSVGIKKVDCNKLHHLKCDIKRLDTLGIFSVFFFFCFFFCFFFLQRRCRLTPAQHFWKRVFSKLKEPARLERRPMFRRKSSNFIELPPTVSAYAKYSFLNQPSDSCSLMIDIAVHNQKSPYRSTTKWWVTKDLITLWVYMI